MKLYEQSRETIERHQCGDPLLRHLTDKILKMIGDPPGRVLDVGCGAGRVAVALARRGFQVEALDSEPRIVEQAQGFAARAGVEVRFFVADFQKADPRFPGESFDAVVCSEVLEHVEPWRDIVGNIHRVLKPGGLFILTTPNDPKQFSALDEYAGHVRRFRWEELASGLSGFTILEAFTVGFPMTRAVHWSYTRVALPFLFKEHAPQEMWREGSPYERIVAGSLYQLARFDDLFNSLRLGTTWVVKACKSRRKAA
jgi:SAM-dependent methyltransferase